MRLARCASSLLTVGALVLSGCTAASLAEAHLTQRARAFDALGTLHDFEVARESIFATIADAESLYAQAPASEDGMVLLVRAWSLAAEVFVEEDLARARAIGDADAIRHIERRQQAARERARYFAARLMIARSRDFEVVQRDPALLGAWLEQHFGASEDAPLLLFAGRAWLDASRLAEASAGDRITALGLLRRSVAIDERAHAALGHTLLGVALAPGAQSARHLERARALHHDRSLLTLVESGEIACRAGDRRSFEAQLDRVLGGGDPDPALRLSNLVAKRRAQRALVGYRAGACGGGERRER